MRRKEQERQLYLFFASRVENIVKFSSRKVRSILDFLNANNGDRMFKLSNLLSLKKERGRLVILRNELER